MAQTDWALGAALASVAIALAALFFSAKAALTQAKAADFNNCLEAVKQLAEAQRKVRDAKDESEKQFEYRELLNLLEALAKLANDRKLQPSTRDYIEHFLIEAWAWLKSEPTMEPLLQSSITSDKTYSEILKFSKRHDRRITALAQAYRASATTQS